MTRKLTQGNEAVFRGAIAAGAAYYAGYPISPSTEILNIASGYAAEHPEFRFLQAEDEIASANAVIGASLAGAKAFTATSGPGFSLMQEAIGYAQKVGVPSVFVNVMRVGPATGMPTMPGQGDIMQVKWGSTGDYTPIAFYPNGVVEAFRVTIQAFNAAEESRSPVVVLSDTFVAHLNEVVDLDQEGADLPVVDRSMAPLARHESAPRFFAGVLMYESGPNAGEPATADADEYLRQFYAAKHLRLAVAERYPLYEHGWKTDADVLLICYGIVSRVASPLRDEVALFRPIRIHPMLTDELRAIADRYREVVVAEANDGQYADMVELALHRPVRRIPLLGGRISLEALRDGMERALSGGPAEPPIPPEPSEAQPRSPLGVG
jgi:2-oxoglutarate ferredoxin oxidoreductase subunit alpha